MTVASPLLEQFLMVNSGNFHYNIVDRGVDGDTFFYKVAFFLMDPKDPIPEAITFTFYEDSSNGESALLFVPENYHYRCDTRCIAEGKFSALLMSHFNQKLRAKSLIS
ncbi:hypothetical protein QR46_1204 [Giardia duodenalis assemblage B]|uniref:Uncharacterized protein n=3 Tax=Giardia intestinalis TaxID=5741 RepID=A0A132NXI1_GIAIN|nr:Hypothetical protein GL50581_689 [Giardia intestinalis ATCC 50581]ESU43806.1 Hypothetical protein GSB_2616 [Giardia intestinalis]KWX14777.1 hypothetical protein QR46_1204 [Giardia intestinalis assemblage B]